ncbi:DEAD/DEAH box helicase [Scrofimicrobium sp. R131]|uniref:DEAD/DEAH box helicase n=1 Tax=Scrofimicrobium appendicitidis TaxID=3079930 RepID=A0AAU7V4H5_9ACTO
MAADEPSAAERMRLFHQQMRVDAAGVDDYLAELPFSADPFQRTALTHLALGRSVLVSAPTGAGKTIVGEGAVYLALREGTRAFYTTPIKALSNQKFREFSARFGADRVGLLTGDTSINPGAEVVVMTTEVLRNMIYAGADLSELGVVILDEIHYLADRVRGPVWEEVLIQLPEEILIVALSATVSNIEEFGRWIREIRSSCEVVVSSDRPVPLYQHMMVKHRIYDLFTTGHTLNPILADVVAEGRRPGRRPIPARINRPRIVELLERKSLLPAIVFIFSRAGCDEAVDQLLAAGVSLTTTSEQRLIREEVEQVLLAVPIADHGVLGLSRWQVALESGIAAHHAGMLPLLKEAVERLFARGLIKVVFATETLALGINMPARTVVLEALEKWNGSEHVRLTPGEYTQLTGRAGRRGIDVEGHAVVLQRGVVQPEELAQLASRQAYPLKSAFYAGYNMVVNLLAHASVGEVREVLESSFAQFQADDAVVGLASKLRRTQSRLAEVSAELHCSQGDAGEYFGLREDLSQLQKRLQRANREGNRTLVAHQLSRLRSGEVVSYRLRRQPQVAVVVGPAGGDWGPPAVRAIGTNGKMFLLSASDLTEPPTRVGQIRLPRSGVRRSRDRAQVAGQLRDFSVAPPRRQSRETPAEVRRLQQEERELEARIRQHPVHSCPDREQHAHLGHEWARIRRERDKIARQINARTSSIALEFDRVLSVLTELGYVRDGCVTERGEQLRQVFGERDLLVTECLQEGIFDGLSTEELAALCSALVYEPRGEAGEAGYLPTRALQQAFGRMGRVFARIHREEQRARLERTKEPSPGLVAVTYEWARGASLSTVMLEADLPAGDFVRWMRQTIDLLEQLRHLDERAEAAVKVLRRGVVQWTQG